MNQDLRKTLWAAADKLRSSMDAAEYKHIVLGLIFVKYISDAFDERRDVLKLAFADQRSELHLPEAADHADALEERDYYTMANVFWVPSSARWEAIRAQAKQADIGVRIDAALEAIEADNPRLKGILDKRFGRTQLEPGRLGELVDLVSTIGFGEGHHAKDLLGEIYEYFLGQFATAEGKKGGQFYTPASVVKVLVEVLAPHHGRVYDPCCGSGGMFVQSEKFIAAHGGRTDDISIYGQEANPTTWRLVAMNLAIRGLAADLGKERTRESFQQFFTLIGKELSEKIEFVCSDMWKPYLQLITMPEFQSARAP
ncbi:MAG: N-6 DNA methylase [Burkholderiales bacterium]|nr:N-6 DNA methylase [Burkholderiales bacterium]